MLEYTEDPIVSSDIVGSPASCTFDSGLSMVDADQRRALAGQGLRVVRQRMGLLEPAARPRRAGRGLTTAWTRSAASRSSGTSPTSTGKRVLVRVDFNVPLHIGVRGKATVADDFRITAALPTLQRLQDDGAEVVACSHLGRPAGAPDPRWEMDPVRGPAAGTGPGVELTENLRFDPGEKANDPAFVQRLIARLRRLRRRGLRRGPPRPRLHRRAAAVPAERGRAALRQGGRGPRAASWSTRPGPSWPSSAAPSWPTSSRCSKVLATKVDTLVVGGGMAFTFLAARGQHVGSSLFDPTHLQDCRDLLDSGVRIRAPDRHPGPGARRDLRPALDGHGPRGSVKVIEGDLPDGWTGLDIGPDTAAAFAREVATGAGTVLWNGPLGAFEDHRFAEGTRIVAEAVAHCPGFSVVGGGDSASALDELGLSDKIGYLSTGGGASLSFIELEGHLPGIDALAQRPERAREGS